MYGRREYNDNLKTLSQHTITYSVIHREKKKIKKRVDRSIIILNIILAMVYFYWEE